MVPFRPKTMYLKKNENIAVDIQQIVCFTTFNMQSGASTPETHDFWEFIYIESGEACVISDEQEVHLLPGDVFFNKPGTVHYTVPSKQHLFPSKL